MALALSKLADFPTGGKKLKIYDLTFTGVTGGKIQTGLSNVFYAGYSPSLSDDHGIVYKNYSDAGTTQSYGDVYVDSVTSGDTGTLLVIGY